MTDRQDDERNGPAATIRDANLKATIWRNEGEERPFYATSFTRTYKDQDGAYRDTSSFVGADLLKLSELARTAYARTNELAREDREQRRDAFHQERGSASDRSRKNNRDR